MLMGLPRWTCSWCRQSRSGCSMLIMGHGRRQLLWVGVTAHPTAEWIANQLTEACGWEQIPRYPAVIVPALPACVNANFFLRLKVLGEPALDTSLSGVRVANCSLELCNRSL